MSVEFHDYSIQVKAALDEKAAQFLEEAASEVESAARRNSRVRSGQLKGSWTHIVSGNEVTIGSPLQNAIWEEYGTGEYAAGGDGRKGGWFYVDAKGHGHFTYGKTPNRALGLAFNSKKAAIEKMFESRLKGMS